MTELEKDIYHQALKIIKDQKLLEQCMKHPEHKEADITVPFHTNNMALNYLRFSHKLQRFTEIEYPIYSENISPNNPEGIEFKKFNLPK